MTVQDIITEFLTGIASDLKNYLADNDRNATGGSSASIKAVNISNTGGQVVGSQGIQWVFTGRGPGGFPPISRIVDWCAARGLPRSLAWIIARNISEQGTKLYRAGGATNNGLTETLTQERVDKFTNSLSVLLAANLNSDIAGIFNKQYA